MNKALRTDLEMTWLVAWRELRDQLRDWRIIFPMVILTLVLAYTLFTQERLVVKGAILMVRNFYGSIRVLQDGQLKDEYATRTLVNGTITHGLQYLAADRRRLATTYYGRQTGIGVAILNTRQSAQRAAAEDPGNY